MQVPEIYIDTSVIGGYFDDEFNGVNLLHGYAQVRIVSPKSLIYGHEKEV